MTVQRDATAENRLPSGSRTGNEAVRNVPEATVARLATYLRVLSSLGERIAAPTVSSDELAVAAGVNSAMLRKDLSFLGSYGIRGVGYDVATLTEEIARTLGLTVHRSVALIGVGNLGQALAGYAGFASRGFRIAALVDADPERVGTTIHGMRVGDIADLERIVAEKNITIAVLATPAVGRAGDLRSARRHRHHEHPQLRAGRADRPAARRRTQGRSGRRVADPFLPREPESRGAAGGRGGAMSLLVVGLSYRTAPVSVLERVSLSAEDLPKVLGELHGDDTISEVLALSTCNRIEVYADVARFHPAVAEITQCVGAACGRPGHRSERAPVRPLRRGGRRAHVLRGVRHELDGGRRVADPGPVAQCLRAGHRRRDDRHRAARPRADRVAGRQAGALRDGHRPRRSVGHLGRARPGRARTRPAARAPRGHRRRRLDGMRWPGPRFAAAASPRSSSSTAVRSAARAAGGIARRPRGRARRTRDRNRRRRPGRQLHRGDRTGGRSVGGRQPGSASARCARRGAAPRRRPRRGHPARRDLRRPRLAARRRGDGQRLRGAPLAGAVLAEELAKYLAQQQALAVAPDRHRAAGACQSGRRRRTRRDWTRRMPGTRPGRAQRGRRRRAARRREGAARADGPGEGACRHARRRPVRRGAARAVRPRPGRGRSPSPPCDRSRRSRR